MAKKELTEVELLEQMKRYGNPQIIPGTKRQVRVKTLEARELLADTKMPDILTPLVIKSVYQDLSDREVREFLGQPKVGVVEALALMDSIDYIVEKALVSGAKPSDLTLAEKRWVFRLVMTPAELLISFHYDEDPDVGAVDEGENVSQAAQ